MVEVLRELLGESVTEEAAAAFLEALGAYFVRKGDAEGQQGQPEAAQAQADEVEDLRAQLEEAKLLAAVDAALRKAGARNEAAVRALLDFDRIGFADGVLTGLDEQIAALKESDGYLFAEDKPAPRSYTKGAFARAHSGRPTKEELAKMTYSQMMAAKKKYPGLEL